MKSNIQYQIVLPMETIHGLVFLTLVEEKFNHNLNLLIILEII